MTHTPTPWTTHSGSIYQDGPDIWPKGDNDGIPIASMDRDTDSTLPTERDANARFIVTAVNTYDDNQRTIARLTEVLRIIADMNYDNDEAVELARQVLEETL
jgi:hypothetical protein